MALQSAFLTKIKYEFIIVAGNAIVNNNFREDSMEFMELAKTRYSVRAFSNKQIENEKLDRILEAAQIAPTAANRQPQKIYVLQSKEALEKINSVCQCIFGAPTVLLIAADENETWKNPYSPNYNTGDIDCSIVATHIMLQAWELGIGSCWVGYFDLAQVETKMGLPENEKLVAILPIGYPSERAKPSPMHSSRKAFGQTVRYL